MQRHRLWVIVRVTVDDVEPICELSSRFRVDENQSGCKQQRAPRLR